MPQPARLSLTVRGRVQGVGFRWHAAEVARRLGLHGWVRNEPGGEVALVAQGERAQLEQLLAWCQQGPPSARVHSVISHWSDPQADVMPGFRIRHH
jgi:acylphosphatase